MNENDTFVPIEKQYKMMNSSLKIYELSLKLIEKGIPISRIKETGIFEDYIKLKFNVKNDNLNEFDEFDKKVVEELKNISEEYKEHT